MLSAACARDWSLWASVSLSIKYGFLALTEYSSLGYLVVPAGGGGTLLGGFLVNRFKLRGSGVIRFCLLCTLISLLSFFVFLTHCPNVPMAGVTASYHGR